MRKFSEFFSELSANVKQKKLLNSIEIAQKILKGETTYDKERDKIAAESELRKVNH